MDTSFHLSIPDRATPEGASEPPRLDPLVDPLAEGGDAVQLADAGLLASVDDHIFDPVKGGTKSKGQAAPPKRARA